MRKSILIFFCVATIILTVLSSANAEKTYRWKYNSLWPSGIALYEADEYFCETVNKLSDGKLKIKLYPAGQLLPGHQNLDAVRKGTIECAGDFGAYWSGKNTAFDILATTPMGMTWIDYMLWIYHGGGQKIYDQIYGEFNCKWLLQNFTPIEAGFRTNTPIQTLEDYKGLKLRIGSLFGQKILKKLGASPILMDGSEVYEAIAREVVDGAEFSIAAVDWTVGFQEITKYWCAPAWYQTAIVLGLIVNEDAWNELPQNLQNVVVQAARATTAYMSSYYEYGNIEATKKFQNAGVEITHLSKESMTRLNTVIEEVLAEEAQKNPDFKMVLQSQIDFMKDFAPVREYESPYTFGTNELPIPDIQ